MSATGSKTPARPLTYAQFKAKKKRREITHTIVTDDDAAARLHRAQNRLKELRGQFGARDEDVAAAQAEQAAAEAAVRESAIVMRLRALPRQGDGSFAALKAAHPPQAEDDARVQEASGNAKDRAVWHTDTFAPALVAATLVDPALTVEEAAELATDLNEAEWMGLYVAALNVNQQSTDTGGLIFS